MIVRVDEIYEFNVVNVVNVINGVESVDLVDLVDLVSHEVGRSKTRCPSTRFPLVRAVRYVRVGGRNALSCFCAFSWYARNSSTAAVASRTV